MSSTNGVLMKIHALIIDRYDYRALSLPLLVKTRAIVIRMQSDTRYLIIYVERKLTYIMT